MPSEVFPLSLFYIVDYFILKIVDPFIFFLTFYFYFLFKLFQNSCSLSLYFFSFSFSLFNPEYAYLYFSFRTICEVAATPGHSDGLFGELKFTPEMF